MFTVDLVAPRDVPGLTVRADGTDLVLENGVDEERFGLRNISLRSRRGDVLEFTADGIEFQLRSVSNHPLDLVEYVLDARAAARGNTVTARRSPRPWPDAQLESPAAPDVDGTPDHGAGAPAERTDVLDAPAKRRRRRKRWRLLVVSLVLVSGAVAIGSVIGDVVDELSGPGVGESVDIGDALVVRDVDGVGSEILTPFSASGPWQVTWEHLATDGSAISIVAISNRDRTERVLVDAETTDKGVVGPLPSGSYRLSIESAGSWSVLVEVER